MGAAQGEPSSNTPLVEPPDAVPEPRDAVPEPRDAVPALRDTGPEPRDAVSEPRDAVPEPRDTAPEPHDAAPDGHQTPRRTKRERFVRGSRVRPGRLTWRKRALRAAGLAAVLLPSLATYAFVADGNWAGAGVAWICPVVWVLAAGTVASTAEFWTEKGLHRVRLRTAHHVRTDPAGPYDKRLVHVYRLRAGDGAEVVWCREGGHGAERDAPPARRVWLLRGADGYQAESTGGLVFLEFVGLVLLCLSAGFTALGAVGVWFCLLGPAAL